MNEQYSNLEITDVQLFPQTDEETGKLACYSANIAINDTFMIQRGTNGEFSIPSSYDAVWNDDDSQDKACEKYGEEELNEIVEYLEIESILADLIKTKLSHPAYNMN